jgi:hypothetical protein
MFTRKPPFTTGPEAAGEVSISIIGGMPPTNGILPEELLLAGLREMALGRSEHLLLGEPPTLSHQKETVEHPDHYRSESGLEAIDVIEAWDLNFNLGNALKYICRAGLKDKGSRSEDLEKAIWYLNRELGTTQG